MPRRPPPTSRPARTAEPSRALRSLIVGAAEITAIHDQDLPGPNSRIGVPVCDADNPDASGRLRRGIDFYSEDDTLAFAAHLIEVAEDQAVEFT